MGFFVLAWVNTWLCNFWPKKKKKEELHSVPSVLFKIKKQKGGKEEKENVNSCWRRVIIGLRSATRTNISEWDEAVLPSVWKEHIECSTHVRCSRKNDKSWIIFQAEKDTLHCAKWPSEFGYEKQKWFSRDTLGINLGLDASHSRLHSISSRMLAKKSRRKYNLSSLTCGYIYRRHRCFTAVLNTSIQDSLHSQV